MPRGGGRSSSPSRQSSPSRSATTAPRPIQRAPQPQAPMMQQAPSTGGGMMSGIGSTIMTGMALGAGSEVGHQAVRSLMGSGSSHSDSPKEQQQQEAPQQQYAQPGQYQQQQQAAPQQSPCYSFNQHLLTCLKTYSNDLTMCQPNMDMLMQCERDQVPRFHGA